MRAQRRYFDLMLGPDRAFTGHRGWLSGRGTSDALLGGASEPQLPATFDPVPPGDFLARPDADMFYFAVDGSGKLAWDRDSIDYFDVNAHVVTLTRAVPDAYRRPRTGRVVPDRRSRSTQWPGRARIGETFGSTTHLVVARPHWSMIRQGLVDEISLVLMPTADAEPHVPVVPRDRWCTAGPVEFAFRSVEALDDGSVWLRYDVVGEIAE